MVLNRERRADSWALFSSTNESMLFTSATSPLTSNSMVQLSRSYAHPRSPNLIDWLATAGFPMPSQELKSISNQNVFFPKWCKNEINWEVEYVELNIVKCPAKDQSRFCGTGVSDWPQHLWHVWCSIGPTAAKSHHEPMSEHACWNNEWKRAIVLNLFGGADDDCLDHILQIRKNNSVQAFVSNLFLLLPLFLAGFGAAA